jgi:hypothetical protein
LRTHFFVDEAGNFDFSTKEGASKYFILTSVTMHDCSKADALIQLRRDMSWEGLDLNGALHATSDKQMVRDRVFDVIAGLDIAVDATIFEKRKTVPDQQEMLTLYKIAWYEHASRVIPRRVDPDQDLHVIAASIDTKKAQIQIASAIKDVIRQCGRNEVQTTVSHWPAATDPCLQIADYCCWAIQRKWERQDDRSHVLIKHLIQSEYDMWSRGSQYYY